MELFNSFKTTVTPQRQKLYKRLYAAMYAARRTNEFLHQMISEWYGKNSLRDLTDDELKDTIKKVNQIRESTSPYKCSAKQFSFIMRLKASLRMNNSQFTGFMKKTCRGKDDLRSLNVSDVAALITGLLKFSKTLKQN